MKVTDRFLLGIVAGVALLVVVAFLLVLNRKELTYQSEDTPQGVAHNYLLALQERDYERAFGYLSPDLAGYPQSVDEFAGDLKQFTSYIHRPEDTSFLVKSSQVSGTRATVQVQVTSFSGGDLFSSRSNISTFEFRFRMIDERWKIFDADEFFAFCWKEQAGCLTGN